MLKREYQHLRKPDDVDTDSETTGLHHSKKQMLKEFLRHINFVPGEPSEADKMTLAKAYKGIQSGKLYVYTIAYGKQYPYREFNTRARPLLYFHANTTGTLAVMFEGHVCMMFDSCDKSSVYRVDV